MSNTAKTPQAKNLALAARLREMHASRTRHFTSPDGAQAWSIVATEDRLVDLLAAAEKLERLAAAQERIFAIQSQVENVQNARNRCKIETDHEWRLHISEVAKVELEKWQASGQNSTTATTVIMALCAKLGVEL